MEDNNVLEGFNLTSNLLMQFFAELDPHKKGYLTCNDWNLAFRNKTLFFLSLKNLRKI